MNAFTKDSIAPRQPVLLLLVLLGGILVATLVFRPAPGAGLPGLKPGVATLAAAPLRPASALVPPAAPPVQEVAPAPTGGSPAVSTTPTPADAPESGGLAETDRAFLEMAAKVTNQENEISGKVLSHLIYPEVREYACTILDAHEAVSAELTALAARKGVVLPSPEKISQRVRGRDDGTLDRRYVSLMAEGNKAAVEMYRQAAGSEDADIAAFARKMLPTVQNQLNAALGLEKLRE